jgi:hypothetical protein
MAKLGDLFQKFCPGIFVEMGGHPGFLSVETPDAALGCISIPHKWKGRSVKTVGGLPKTK